MKINRINDYLFKWIFGKPERKDLLLSFINAVLAEGKDNDIIRDIELIDRELDPAFAADKASRLDILGETMDGTKINIEVQTANEGDISSRSLYYWAKIYQEQLKEGMQYKDLSPVIAINLLKFNFFKSEEYHSQFEIREKYRNEQLNDNLQIHFIELNKWEKLSIKARNRLERWLLFLANNDPIELGEIAMEDMNITKALEAEKKFLSSEQARYIYNLREKAKLDWDSAIANAESRGIEQGIEQGILDGKRDVARNLLSKGMSIQEVSEITGLVHEELVRLVHNATNLS